jgi:DNA polymerase-1
VVSDLIAPGPGRVLVVTDYTAQEVAVAAHLSRDGGLTADYLAGDVHVQTAIRAGAAPSWATKATHKAVRNLYKTVNLGTLYGRTHLGIAQATGLHPLQAQALLRQHQRLYPVFHTWADAFAARAFLRGSCRTVGGWPRRVGREDGWRSVTNAPIQGGAADLLRLSVVYLDRLHAPLLTTLHDSFIFETTEEELPHLQEVIDHCLDRAVQQLLPGSPMRWETAVYRDRYQDEDGEAAWKRVSETVLGEVERVS